MTEPIPKPDLAPAKINGALRWLLLGVGLATLFTGVTLAMLHALPAPHTPADYLMAGGLATMITMLALFGALLNTKFRSSDPFFKRRQK